jgi:hypothetical protein
MKKVIIATIIVVCSVLFAFANASVLDEVRSERSKTVDTTLSIRLEKDATEARLMIPKGQLRQLRAELDQLDDEGGIAEPFAFSQVNTVVAGMLMSLAFVFGGVWFARKGNCGGAAKALGVGAVMLAGGAFATLVFANAGPPSEARSITGKIFSQPVHLYKFASGRIKLETSDDAKNVVLIVPDTVARQDEE